jgi:hypothetical protein
MRQHGAEDAMENTGHFHNAARFPIITKMAVIDPSKCRLLSAQFPANKRTQNVLLPTNANDATLACVVADQTIADTPMITEGVEGDTRSHEQRCLALCAGRRSADQ